MYGVQEKKRPTSGALSGAEAPAALEGEPHAELADEGARQHRGTGTGVDESCGLQEAAGARGVHDVVAIVGTIGQVEALEQEVQIVAFLEVEKRASQLEEIFDVAINNVVQQN